MVMWVDWIWCYWVEKTSPLCTIPRYKGDWEREWNVCFPQEEHLCRGLDQDARADDCWDEFPPLYLTDDIKKMQKTPKQTDPNRRFHNSTGLRKRCDLHHCGCNGVQCFPPTVPASPKWRDGSCSTWQVNCCHLVDESKTATKAWTRNEKKKCPQTYEDQESLGSKSGRISFFKIFIWM